MRRAGRTTMFLPCADAWEGVLAMRFYMFHLMPWPYLPDDFAADPRHGLGRLRERPVRSRASGHEVYNRYLDELELADQLGFDGICVNEHHQNAYGLMPSPNIMAACLARRTTHAKLVILGNVLTLYDHPLRVAEEIAMLDVISGGRVVSGQVVGHRQRVLLLQRQPDLRPRALPRGARADPQGVDRAGPVRLGGRALPVPLRQRLAASPSSSRIRRSGFPGSGSRETIEWVAEQRYTYMVLPTLAPYAVRARTAPSTSARPASGRATRARHEQIGWGIGIYVAETDAQAVEEYEPHFWYYARNLLRNRDTFNAPPGHSSIESMLGMLERAAQQPARATSRTWEEIQKAGYVVVGSPATVRDRLKEIAARTGLGTLVPNFSVGNVPHAPDPQEHGAVRARGDAGAARRQRRRSRWRRPPRQARAHERDETRLRDHRRARDAGRSRPATGRRCSGCTTRCGNRWTAAPRAAEPTHFRVIAPSAARLRRLDHARRHRRARGRGLLAARPARRAGARAAVLLGCGLGGWMAAEFAVRYPERLGGLVLVDAYGLRVEGALAADEFALTPPMLRPLVFADAGWRRWRRTGCRTSSRRSGSSARCTPGWRRRGWPGSSPTTASCAAGSAARRCRRWWSGASRTGWCPAAHAHAYAEGLPDARLDVIPDAGHYPYLETPEQFTHAIERFLG